MTSSPEDWTGGGSVVQLHWGGGTPTYLDASQLEQLFQYTRERFNFAPDAEIGIEVDPRATRSDQLRVLRRLGFNRISMGIQDFNPEVQRTVHRIQPYEMTRALYDLCRELKFDSVNVDLIYGLPHQTPESFVDSVDKVILMRPDRVAMFSYAHVPWLKKQQGSFARHIPQGMDKFRIFRAGIERFTEAGYTYIGMDHFALPDDELCLAQRNRTLHRNFQGYTTKAGADLFGVGVSSISGVGRAYAQNQRDLKLYYGAVGQRTLPTMRGTRLDADDALRREVISRILCHCVLHKVGDRVAVRRPVRRVFRRRARPPAPARGRRPGRAVRRPGRRDLARPHLHPERRDGVRPVPAEAEGPAGLFQNPVNGPKMPLAENTGGGERRGVLLFNLGGPETLADVRPFLFNLFSDPDIIRIRNATARRALAWLIATTRQRKSRDLYRQIGGGSPLRRITGQQAAALEQRLASRGMQARVYVGMRCWKPSIDEAVDRIRKDGITRLAALPLFPQFSFTTTGSCFNYLRPLLEKSGLARRIAVSYVQSWFDNPLYLECMADLILEARAKFTSTDPGAVHLLYSAHSIPARYVDEGDPYLEQTRRTVELLDGRLGNASPSTLAFQSKVGPVKWLEPATSKVLQEMGKKGIERVLAVPVSFVSDHIETLQEIDILYRDLAAAAGIREFYRAAAPNLHPKFIDALAEVAAGAFGIPAVAGGGPNPPR